MSTAPPTRSSKLPPSVGRFGWRLITLTRSLLGLEPPDILPTWLVGQHDRPACLSATAVGLLQDTLAKGLTRRLATMGWRTTRHLRAGRPIAGRLWERTPPREKPLRFSRNVLAWLIWALSENVTDPKSEPDVDEPSLTIADRIFFALAAQPLSRMTLFGPVQSHPAFCRNGLIWLEHLRALSNARVLGAPDFDRWTSDDNRWVLEAWQDTLANAWNGVAWASARVRAPEEAARLGDAVSRTLDRMATSVDRHGARDLTRFLLEGLRRFCSEQGMRHEAWFRDLDLSGWSMSDRQRAYAAGLALPRFVCGRLAEWRGQARAVGFTDENYAASQLWKLDWEDAQGDRTIEQAAALMRRFPAPSEPEPEPFDPTSGIL